MKGKEREHQGKEEPIVVRKITVVWRNPGQFPNDVSYYVADDRPYPRQFSNLRGVVGWLSNGNHLSSATLMGGEEEIDYQQEPFAQLLHADGYFGRPKIPAEVEEISGLNREEIEEFEGYLANLREKEARTKSIS